MLRSVALPSVLLVAGALALQEGSRVSGGWGSWVWASVGIGLVFALRPPSPAAKSPPSTAADISRTKEIEESKVEEEQRREDGGSRKAVVVVDPFSTGAVLAQMMQERGFHVIRVISKHFPPTIVDMVPAACRTLSFVATIQHEDDVDETVQKLRLLGANMDIVAITVGCESGVELSDALSSRFGGVPTNGEAMSATRRDKYLMGEAVRKAGLRAAKQVMTDNWAELQAFMEAGVEGGKKREFVIKPLRSAGTENVSFVQSVEDARRAFDEIMGHTNVFGEINTSVLAQEFLKGPEYVVDCVSCDGEHKVVAIWAYEKRSCNNAKFVYFSVNLFESADGKREQKMAAYIFKVLDALGVKNGPSHSEVIYLEDEDTPCLVEVGSRPHGGEGTFTELSTPALGYNQLSAMIDTIEGKEKFKALPTLPQRFRTHAREVTLISREEGILEAYLNLDKVRSLPTFKSLELKMPVGDPIKRTVDFLTSPGSVMLVGDAEQVVRDQETIHEMSKDGQLFQVRL